MNRRSIHLYNTLAFVSNREVQVGNIPKHIRLSINNHGPAAQCSDSVPPTKGYRLEEISRCHITERMLKTLKTFKLDTRTLCELMQDQFYHSNVVHKN